jgi:hypothetical protein
MGANRRASQHIRHGLDGEGMQSEIAVLSSVEDPPNHFPQRARKIPSNLSITSTLSIDRIVLFCRTE